MIALNGLVLSLRVRSALMWGLCLLCDDECFMNSSHCHLPLSLKHKHTHKQRLEAVYCCPLQELLWKDRSLASGPLAVSDLLCWSCLYWCCIFNLLFIYLNVFLPTPYLCLFVYLCIAVVVLRHVQDVQPCMNISTYLCLFAWAHLHLVLAVKYFITCEDFILIFSEFSAHLWNSDKGMTIL